MSKTETLNLRVSTEFKRQLIEEARKEKRSVTNYIEAALTEFWRMRVSGATHSVTKKKA
jgi:predicted HicB family RNase H-like nuclease